MIGIFSIVILVICFIGLIIGSITDIQTREVPDSLSFGLIAIGFGISIIASIIFQDLSFIIASFLGFVFCFFFACIMFYAKQWGGGDAKMLMAIGALIGINPSKLYNILTFAFPHSLTYSALQSSVATLPILFLFLFLVFFIGGLYGLVWLIILLSQNWKGFKENYLFLLSGQRHKKCRVILFVFVLMLIAVSFFVSYIVQLFFFLLSFLLLFSYYSYLMIKVVEKIAMIKQLPVDKVTEGDWVAEDIVVDGKTVVCKGDLGISSEQLQEFSALAKKNKIKTIKIKYGIPFVPSFLLALIATVLVYFL